MRFLDREYIRLDVTVNSPEDAIQQSGEVLVNTGDVESRYVEQMISNYHKNGPYFVIAPQIAMPHARPEDGVTRSALSFVRLKEAIAFGHQANDPVQIVISLAASSSNDHLELLQKLSRLLGNQQLKERLLTVPNILEMEEIIKENIK